MSDYASCFTMQMARNNQLFMKNVTEFSFTVCCCDWQITTDYLNSPAVTSTHLAPCAAQNKHSLLQIASDPPTPAGVGCISAPDGWNQLFLTHPLKLQPVSRRQIPADRTNCSTQTSRLRMQTRYRRVSVFTCNEGSVFPVNTKHCVSYLISQLLLTEFD